MLARLCSLNLAAAMTTGLREYPALRRTHNVSHQGAHRVSESVPVRDGDCASKGRCASQLQLRIWDPLTRNARSTVARERVAHQRRITYGAISMILFVNACYLWGSAPRNECLCVRVSMTTVSHRIKPLTKMDHFGVAPALHRLSYIYFTQQQLPCIEISHANNQSFKRTASSQHH